MLIHFPQYLSDTCIESVSITVNPSEHPLESGRKSARTQHNSQHRMASLCCSFSTTRALHTTPISTIATSEPIGGNARQFAPATQHTRIREFATREQPNAVRRAYFAPFPLPNTQHIRFGHALSARIGRTEKLSANGRERREQASERMSHAALLRRRHNVCMDLCCAGKKSKPL